NQRNFGLEQGAPRHSWVLHLDADEVVTPAFRDQLAELQPHADVDAYRIPSKLMMNEYWLMYAGMYPTYQVRLGHRDRLRFTQVGHGQREIVPPSRIATFDEPYLHYNFSQGLAAWLHKHVQYADDEARLLVAIREGQQVLRGSMSALDSMQRRRVLKQLAARLPLVLRPAARIFYVLVWRRGILDGRYGVLYALMLGVYEAMIAILAMDKSLRRNR
ncbi:MAG: hypothetical protein ABI645_10300, partial [Pseudomonadota bacterium]